MVKNKNSRHPKHLDVIYTELKMNIRVYFISLFTIALVGCGEPKFDYLFVKNDTDIQLSISAQFENKKTKLSPLVLAPGEEDGWRFSAKNGKLVESFQQLQAKTSECEVSFSREKLNTMIEKDGAYRLVLNKNHIDC